MDKPDVLHSAFEYKNNPFRRDIEGKRIEFSSETKMSKSLSLRPDLNTLRDAIFMKGEAIVLADVLDPDTGELVPYAPRNMLKKALLENPKHHVDT
jgi:glutamine synthetase